MPAETKQLDIERRVRLAIAELERQHAELGYLMRDAFVDQQQCLEMARGRVGRAIDELRDLENTF